MSGLTHGYERPNGKDKKSIAPSRNHPRSPNTGIDQKSAPDQPKIETENKYAEDHANEQRRDKDLGIAA
jgi:hypothetical protein